MKQLLTALTSQIALQVPYLRWVGVLESELLPPEEPGFPIVGLLDGGTVNDSRPGQKDIQTLTVIVLPYQSIILDEPGAAMMGSDHLGSEGKGLLEMGDRLRTLLNDNFLNLSFYWAHCDRQEPCRTLQSIKKDDTFVQYQRNTFTYRRYV